MKEKATAFFKDNLKGIIFSVFSLGVLYSFSLALKKSYAVPEIRIMLITAGVISALITVLLYFFVVKKDIKPEKAAFIGILISGIMYITVFPPYTIPDEPLHYYTAYSYSNFLVGEEYTRDDIVMRQADFDFCEDTFSANESENGIYITTRLYQNSIENIKEYNGDKAENEVVTTKYSTIYNRGIMYITASVGIAAGRLLKLNPVTVFDLGRFFNLILYAVLIFFAVKKTPVLKSAIACISMLPMMLHLAASYSYDCFNMAVLMIMFSYIVSFIARSERIKTVEIIAFSVITFIIVPLKVAYWFLVPAVLFIPKANLGGKLKSILFKCWAIIVPAVITVALQIGKLAKDGGNTLIGETVTYTPGWVITHIPETAAILIKTVSVSGPFYLATALGDRMGWLQIIMPKALLVLIFAVLTVSLFGNRGEATLKCGQRVFSAGLFVFGYFAILGLLMLDWTPLGSELIMGVQGRYFIPLMPLLGLAFQNKKIARDKVTDTLLICLMFTLNCAAVFNTLMKAV